LEIFFLELICFGVSFFSKNKDSATNSGKKYHSAPEYIMGKEVHGSLVIISFISKTVFKMAIHTGFLRKI